MNPFQNVVEPTDSKKDKNIDDFLGENATVPNEQLIDEIFQQHATKHAADAIDYEDIDELADDDELLEDEAPSFNSENIMNSKDEPTGTSLDVEKQLETEADLEFDDIFGENNEELLGTGNGLVTNDRLFGDLDSAGLQYDEHDFNDLDFGAFDESLDNTRVNNRKRSLNLQEREQRRINKRAKLEQAVKKLEKKRIQKQLAHYFPSFSNSKSYNNHLLFLLPPKYYSYKVPAISLKSHPKPLIPRKVTLEVEDDSSVLFRSRLLSRYTGKPQSEHCIDIKEESDEIVEMIKKEAYSTKNVPKIIDFLNRDGADTDRFSEFSKDLILTTADWDDRLIIDGELDISKEGKNSVEELVGPDFDFIYGDGIFEGQIVQKLNLDMNDPNLLFLPKNPQSERLKSSVVSKQNKLWDQKFDVSNDSKYETLKGNYESKVRSQLSNLNIEHSLPALRLQTPYYKVKLNPQESRYYHRPSINFRSGTLISFSKLKQRKKKSDKGKSAQELFAKSSDLTLADSAKIIGMEYSEEYPLLLSNFGMGSKLINYYRKEKENDSSRPKAALGETHVLGVEDRSPFWNFGYVAKGDFVPTLYNNFIRAPVFQQETKSTDFLLLRSHGAGSYQKYYLRPINHFFAVGNVFPAIEIPAPHSRKVTNTSKNRLKMIVFRAMNSNEESKVSVKDISHHFPDQNDMQNRQRLKEFMEYQRHGEDQGFWKIKNSDVVPPEEDIKAMVTPEDVVILDSMQHGQQMLEDSALLFGSDLSKNEKKEYKKNKEEQGLKDSKEEEKTKLKGKDKELKEKDMEDDNEESLAPWTLTRNFINATQSKSMLQLNGEGDPTGIGLGFSLLRASQKNVFTPLFPPPKETVPKNSTAAYQQKLYEEEISRIWYSQRRSLTVDALDPNELKAIYDEYKPADHYRTIKNKIKREKDPVFDNQSDERGKRVLRITRRVRDENGVVQRKIETISDYRLIGAYIRSKKQIEDEMLKNAEVNDIIPTNDKELNKLRRKALEEKLASLERKAKSGRGRKSHKDTLHAAAAAAGGTIIDANTVLLPDGSYAIGGKGIGKGKSKLRRCAACGAFGHNKTNKGCPMYNKAQGTQFTESNSLASGNSFSNSPTPSNI